MDSNERREIGDDLGDGLRRLGVGRADRVLVAGQGRIARQAVVTLQSFTDHPVSLVVPGDRGAPHAGGRVHTEADVLVDASGDAASWRALLGRLRREGRALLLVPPGEQAFGFDFADRVHRSSLVVHVRRVGSLE